MQHTRLFGHTDQEASKEGAESDMLDELKKVARENPAVDSLLRSIMAAHLKRKQAFEDLEREHEALKRAHDETRGLLEAAADDNAELTVKNRELARQVLERGLEATGLQQVHLAVLRVNPGTGEIVYGNHAADMLFGAPVGTSVFAVFLNSVRPYANVPTTEDSFVGQPPLAFGHVLWERLRDGFTRVYERVFLKTVVHPDPVDAVLMMKTVRDDNGHPWILVEALEIERLNRDPMSGLFRREVAIAALSRELAHRERVNEDIPEALRLSVIMMDIDDFKRFNTLYEYEGGNRVIRRVSGVIAAEIRTKDLPVRWFSGDEFLIVVYAGHGVACRVAERICERVKALRIPVRDAATGRETRAQVSVSVGVAESVPHDGWETLTHRAEMELKRAKDRGKGRVSTSRMRRFTPPV